MLTTRVYFVGSSGVGKTTLAEYVAKRHGLIKLPSAARKTLADHGETDFAAVLDDLDRMDEFQGHVFQTQRELEAEHESFVSDRAFDHICYTSEYARVTWMYARRPEFAEYLNKLRSPRTVIFFVRPTRLVFDAAVAEGSRPRFLEWDAIQRMDGTVQYILESNEFFYIPISTPILRERQRLIDGVLNLLPKK